AARDQPRNEIATHREHVDQAEAGATNRIGTRGAALLRISDVDELAEGRAPERGVARGERGIRKRKASRRSRLLPEGAVEHIDLAIAEVSFIQMNFARAAR